MPPTLKQLGLDRLSPADRLAVAQALIKSVRREPPPPPLSDAKKADLDARVAHMAAHPDDDVAWKDVYAGVVARSSAAAWPVPETVPAVV